jgi:hypothetical protein
MRALYFKIQFTYKTNLQGNIQLPNVKSNSL